MIVKIYLKKLFTKTNQKNNYWHINIMAFGLYGYHEREKRIK